MVYNNEELSDVLSRSRKMLFGLRDAVLQVEQELSESTEEDKIKEILKRAGILKFYGNPLVKKSIEACR